MALPVAARCTVSDWCPGAGQGHSGQDSSVDQVTVQDRGGTGAITAAAVVQCLRNPAASKSFCIRMVLSWEVALDKAERGEGGKKARGSLKKMDVT